MRKNFEIQEMTSFRLENNEILFSEKTIKDLGLTNESLIKLPNSDKESPPIVIKPISLPNLAEAVDGIGYVNAHVYAQISGRRVSRNSIDLITLGADPEFFLVDLQEKQAKNFNMVQYAKKRLGLYGRDIGLDGAGFIGEFRPTPGKDEGELTNNISELVKRTHSYINQAVENGWMVGPKERWVLEAHSYFAGRPAGFHIHLGLPSNMLRDKYILYPLVKSLDYFLGVLCLKIDKQINRRVRVPGIRMSGNYGGPFAFKYGSVTLEYRMPGGYHLRNPELTKGIVGMASAVAEDFITRTKVLKKKGIDQEIIYKMPDYEEIKKAFKMVSHPEVNKWYEEVVTKSEKLITFRKHKRSILKLLDVVNLENELSSNISENWQGGVVNEVQKG